VETEIAVAQAQATAQQIHEKIAQQDLTRSLDLTSDASALCPACGARTEGAKFCPECGKPLRPKSECPRCGTKMEGKARFCPECGQKVT
jgi:predicted amidophosphoribosyltransferase